MSDVFCINCGKNVYVYNTKGRNMYYEFLGCPECFNMPIDHTDKEIKIDQGTVYSRWLKKLSILSNFNNITGGIYHPLTGEFIEDIDKYLYDTGFKI